MRILLAEDSPSNQKLALHMLERLGYQADLATNGREAVAAVLRQPYDVVLMDMQMPEMDGLEATRRIRREAPLNQQPVIVALTANDLQGDREACAEAGMNDYITKPLRVEELVRFLRACKPTQAQQTPTPLAARSTSGDSTQSFAEIHSIQGEERVIDPKALDRLSKMTGDERFVVELIDSYLTSSPKLLADLRQGLDQQDAAKLRRAAHTLKSSSADFGAMTLSGYCKELERLGNAGIFAGAAELTAKAEVEYARVVHALKARQGGKVEEPKTEVAANGKQRGTILAVDDYLVNRQKLQRLLTQFGHTVLLAENGKQALEALTHQPVDLMLLDIMMPEMDGYQVLAHLKEHNLLSNLPVIVISALDEMDSVVKCIEMGAEDYLPKPFDPVLLKARIGACLEKKRLHDLEREQRQQLSELNKELEIKNHFIRKTFGRYLSEEVVSSILESPEGLTLGGEKRTVTIMMTDLRGFTAIGERQSAETVVSMLNIYLNIMTDIIFKYHGTIDEFIGDAILAMFGAPVQREDDASRAVTCALEMQLAMQEVNRINASAGYPEMAMGIGINTGSVIVGNIGSHKRTKYGVVGRNVNLTSRIESYTVGGQIFISECTLAACGPILRIDGQMEVMPKGVKEPITIYEVGGIGGEFDIALPKKRSQPLVALERPILIEYLLLEEKHAGDQTYPGRITHLLPTLAEMDVEVACPTLTNIKISVFDKQRVKLTDDLYGKVTTVVSEMPPRLRVAFTSIPQEAAAFFDQLLAVTGKTS